jgi:putative DNA primase/helicase
MRLIPFNRQFTESETDPQLFEKLKAELPHILAWAAEGAKTWGANGLGTTPAAVSEATEEYRAERDYVTHFVDECCEVTNSDDDWTSTGALYQAFETWCEAEGIRRPIQKSTFGSRLIRPGVKSDKRKGARGVSGIKLKPDAETVKAVNDDFFAEGPQLNAQGEARGGKR